MGPGPQQSPAYAARWIGWIDPPWRHHRSAERRAGAWAALAASCSAYLFALLALGDAMGAPVALLYAAPCLVAGWAFGASGGLVAGLFFAPLHAWLFAARVVPSAAPGASVVLAGIAASLAAGLLAGITRELRERARARRSGPLEAPRAARS